MKYFFFLISTFLISACSDDTTSFTTRDSNIAQGQESKEPQSELDAIAQKPNPASNKNDSDDLLGSKGDDNNLGDGSDDDLGNGSEDGPGDGNEVDLGDGNEGEPKDGSEDSNKDAGDDSEDGPKNPEEMDKEEDKEEPKTTEKEPKKTIEEEVKEVQLLCNNSAGKAAMQEYVQEVFFEEVTDCNWGENGNEPLDDINNTFQVARVDQKFELDFKLSQEKQICSMDIDVPMQDMLFDDHMLLTLNDYVVTSSVDFSIPKLEAKALPIEDGLVKYSWNHFKGMPFGNGLYNGVKPYCVGIEATALDHETYTSVCDIPVTHTFGSMTIDVPEATATKMALKIKEKAKESHLRFNLITTGDNDRYDCKHKAFRFSVKVQYLD